MRRLAPIFSLLTACGGAPSPVAGAEARSPYDRVLAADDIDGESVGAAPADTRVTALVVFASWCDSCRHELSVLAEVHRETPQLRIIGLNAYESWNDLSNRQELSAFLHTTAPWLRVVAADAELLEMLGGVPRIPSIFFYDADGRLISSFNRRDRPLPTDIELRAAIAAAVGAG